VYIFWGKWFPRAAKLGLAQALSDKFSGSTGATVLFPLLGTFKRELRMLNHITSLVRGRRIEVKTMLIFEHYLIPHEKYLKSISSRQ